MSTYVLDTFTDVGNVKVVNHVAEQGSPWVTRVGYGGGDFRVVDGILRRATYNEQANDSEDTGAYGTGFIRPTEKPPTQNFFTEVKFRTDSSAGAASNIQIELAGYEYNSGDEDLWYDSLLTLSINGSTAELYFGSNFTGLSCPPDTTNVFRLEYTSALFKAYLNDVLITTQVPDPSFPGEPGNFSGWMWLGLYDVNANDDDKKQLHVESFEIGDIVAGPAPTNTSRMFLAM